MIKARGLHHINLNVRDIGRSLKFYQEAFGLEVDFWEGKKMVFLHSPGAHDTITRQGPLGCLHSHVKNPTDREHKDGAAYRYPDKLKACGAVEHTPIEAGQDAKGAGDEKTLHHAGLQPPPLS